MKTRRLFSLLLVLLAGPVAPATAGIILLYNNLDTANDEASEPDNSGENYSVSSPSLASIPPGTGIASSFTASQTDTLRALELALGATASSVSVTASLRPDVNGLPGPPLESFTFTGLVTFPQSRVLEGDSLTHPLLTAGTQYWVAVVVPASSPADALWFLSLIADGPIATSLDEGSFWGNVGTGELNGFEVEGDPLGGSAVLPEPSTLAVLLIALVGMASHHAWQRRRAGMRLALPYPAR
jgi:hypothetical protein